MYGKPGNKRWGSEMDIGEQDPLNARWKFRDILNWNQVFLTDARDEYANE